MREKRKAIGMLEMSLFSLACGQSSAPATFLSLPPEFNLFSTVKCAAHAQPTTPGNTV